MDVFTAMLLSASFMSTTRPMGRLSRTQRSKFLNVGGKLLQQTEILSLAGAFTNKDKNIQWSQARSMSALGQKQTYAVHNGMSALPPKADMCGATRDVRFGPKADIGSLFDHPVGALLEMHRHVEAKRLSGFQIDHQLEFDRSLDGKLTWLLALKDAIDIRGRSPKIID